MLRCIIQYAPGSSLGPAPPKKKIRKSEIRTGGPCLEAQYAYHQTTEAAVWLAGGMANGMKNPFKLILMLQCSDLGQNLGKE